jgi:hypothetical protein
VGYDSVDVGGRKLTPPDDGDVKTQPGGNSDCTIYVKGTAIGLSQAGLRFPMCELTHFVFRSPTLVSPRECRLRKLEQGSSLLLLRIKFLNSYIRPLRSLFCQSYSRGPVRPNRNTCRTSSLEVGERTTVGLSMMLSASVAAPP